MGNFWSSENNEEEPQAASYTTTNMAVVAQQSITPRRLRNPKVTILKEILAEKVRLDDKLVTENNKVLRSFLESFIPVMKAQDSIFDKIYNRIFYTGSFYSDLRVSKPDEFDLNLVLKLPIRMETVSIEYCSQVASYVKYKLNDEKVIKNEYSYLAKFFEDGYLMPENVRRWMQSIVDKALKRYDPHTTFSCKMVWSSAAGPARTMKLVLYNGGEIDIDLVPVIEFSTTTKPPGIRGDVYNQVKVQNSLQGFLVPKPYQTNKQLPINEAERLRLWRAHYPVPENNLIHGYGCVKPVIKLLKLLRDKENWKILASYYLKTVVMWMIFKNPRKEYWTEDKLGDRFTDALQELADCIERRHIPYFFSSRCNLIEKISEPQANNLHNRLCYIIRDINNNNWNLWRIFGCSPTFDFDL